MAENDIIKDAKAAFDEAVEAESENRAEALDDIRFGRLRQQWDPRDKQERERQGRPVLTINKLPAFMRQVLNDGRQNKPAIVCHPVDDTADPDTAQIFNGLIRNIEQSSNADVAYDTAFEGAVCSGFGYFAIDLVYARDDAFDQDIVIKRIANPFSVYGDPSSVEADSSDWNVAFVLDTLRKSDFQRRFGKDRDAVSFSDAPENPEVGSRATDNVTIASYWTREETKRRILLLSDGQILAEDDYVAQKALFDGLGITVVGQPREVPSYSVKQRLLSGADVLETVDWAGKYIPIVPVYGEEINLEGKRYFQSLIRGAKDAQRRYNYHITTATEITANQTRTPWIGKKGTFDTDAERWATANTEAHAYLQYDGEAPTKTPMSGVPVGEVQAALTASDDMKAVMGLHDASLGNRSNETSGRAIMARQREGDVGTYHFHDNLSRAIRHAGRILVDLIPKVYSVPRVVRTIGPEGEQDIVRVNQEFETEERGPDGQVQKISKIYDLTTGRYDVTVKSGPSFTSRREEAATQMIELIRAYPAAAPVIGDLLATNLDWPGAETVAERLKSLLPPELKGESPEAAAASAQMEKMAGLVQQLQVQLQEAENDRAIAARKVEIDGFKAETDRLKVSNDVELHRLRTIVAQLTGNANLAA